MSSTDLFSVYLVDVVRKLVEFYKAKLAILLQAHLLLERMMTLLDHWVVVSILRLMIMFHLMSKNIVGHWINEDVIIVW